MLEGKNCNLTQVKIDEVLCLVCYIAAKVSANNAMPTPSSRSYLLDICCNVLFYVVLLHGLCSTVYSILLHVLGHVRILDHSLSVRHGEPKAEHRFL
uniref:Dynein light chain n=1 Tax=Ficedula albicollis TaxID=59894 RepID=A0A803WBZ2_FICAL